MVTMIWILVVLAMTVIGAFLASMAEDVGGNAGDGSLVPGILIIGIVASLFGIAVGFFAGDWTIAFH